MEKRKNSFYILQRQNSLKNNEKLTVTYKLKGHSLCCKLLDNKNCLRKAVFKSVNSSAFIALILGTILISTLSLIFQNPSEDPESTMQQACRSVDKITTWVFLVETVLKIVAYGFIWNGKDSYLR